MPNKTASGGEYERHRDRMGAVGALKSRAGRDIGQIPAVVDPVRKITCCRSFSRFCELYFPHTFTLAWSADHRRMIEKIERAVLEGQRFAMAMPRGSGKTTLAEIAEIFASVTGARRFAVIVGSDKGHAIEMLDSIKVELSTNQRLAEDFPEVIYPIQRLENIAQRAGGQLCNGKPTGIYWGKNRIILPAVDGSRASGAILQAAGLTAGIRGMKFKRRDGITVRPDFVIIDDPQTDESAKSPTQVDAREKLIKGAVLGLAGPDKKISAVMPCTVIAPDDLADRILNRDKHPEWQGERTKLLYGWPTRDDLWDQYRKIRADGFRAGDNGSAATAFYAANREQMDDGATAAWPVRFLEDEISAIQCAMNIWIDRGKEAFAAEYQNEPINPDAETKAALTADQIMAKADGRPRGIVPKEATRLVSFIDVQQELLYFGVLALEDDFSGHLIHYGTYPDQKRSHFAKSNVKYTLMKAENAAREEEAIYKGLESLTSLLLGRDWKREDGGAAKIDRCLIDAHWGKHAELVKRFCRKSSHAAVLTPSFGVFVGASSLPMADQPSKKGDRCHPYWRMPIPKPGEARHVRFDANYWKGFLLARLAQARGGGGCFTIFGDPDDHRLLADHVLAEYQVATTGRGRQVIEFKNYPHRPDNDLLDVWAGCCVAGSIAGASLAEMKIEKAARRLRPSEIQAARRARLNRPN